MKRSTIQHDLPEGSIPASVSLAAKIRIGTVEDDILEFIPPRRMRWELEVITENNKFRWWEHDTTLIFVA